jgi:hypothetical protein
MADDKKLGLSEVDDETFANAVFEDGGSLIIDLGNVEEMKFELIPKGIYEGTIDEFTFGKSKSSGAAMFTAVLEIDGGDYAGRKLYSYMSFSQKALKGTKTNLMRIDPETFAGQFDPQKIADSGVMLGKRVRFRVTHQERQDTGEPQASVGQFLALDNAGSSSGGDGGGKFFG